MKEDEETREALRNKITEKERHEKDAIKHNKEKEEGRNQLRAILNFTPGSQG
jgi:hypothetical protein